MIVEWYGLKCAFFGAFITYFAMRNRNKKPVTYEIKEI